MTPSLVRVLNRTLSLAFGLALPLTAAGQTALTATQAAAAYSYQLVPGSSGASPSYAWLGTAAVPAFATISGASSPVKTTAVTANSPVADTPITLTNPIGTATGGAARAVMDKQFLAARFTLTVPTRIVSAFAEFTFSTGSLFVAVVPLASLTALPGGTTELGTPFNPGEVAFSTTFTRSNTGAGVETVPLNFDVQPGVYGIVFGSGVLGASGSGGVPPYNAVAGSTGFMRNGPVGGPFLWRDTGSSQYNIGIVTSAETTAAPTFVVQPSNASVPPVTGTATFQVEASGDPAPTFQWQRQAAGTVGFTDIANNATFSGATTKTLAVTAPPLAMHGDLFRCVITNTLGTATSQSATLLLTGAVSITTQPVDQTVTTGQSATFSVVATGSGALNYLWRRNGIMILGGLGSALTIAGATRADADDYDVIVFPAAGGAAVTSNPVSLRVAPSSYPAIVAPDPAWNLQPENDTASVSAILRLPDGRAYVGGAFLRAGGVRRTSVMRLTADGAVDPGFVPPEIDNTVSALAVQADGRLVIAGAFSRVDGVARSRLARLESTGQVDPAFNFGGVGPSSTPAAVAVLPDGNIVLGGGFSSYNGTSVNRLVWLDSRGALLPDARNDPAGGATAPINVLLVLPGGRLAVGGNVTANGTVAGGLAVLRADGAVDPTFIVGAGGNSGGAVMALAAQPDGKLIAGGTFTTFSGFVRNRIVRLDFTGAVDPTFDPGPGFTNTVRSIALQADGKMVVAGTLVPATGASNSDLTRLLATGGRDPGFVAPVPSSNANAVELQPDGRILLGGSFTSVGPVSRDGVARLGPDGALDAGFDLDLHGSVSIGAMALLPGGQVLLARSFAYLRGVPVPARIARFNADGSRDPTFNAGGTGADNTIYSLVRMPDGRIVIGGSFTTYNGVAAGRLTRLNADGTPDPSYNPGGAGFSDAVNSIAPLSGGALAVGGTFLNYNGAARNYLARLGPDGALDSNFAPVLNGTVDVVASYRDGRLLVAGAFTAANGVMASRLARFLPVGVNDPTFSVGVGPNGTVTALALLPDDRILVAGTFTSFNGVAQPGLVRLNADGSFDAAFSPVIAGGYVYSLHVQEDGRVIVRGTFTSVGGRPGTAALARINPDGTADAAFASGGIVPSGITYTRMLMRDDGKLFVPAGTSVGLQVTQNAALPVVTGPPASASIQAGQPAVFTVSVSSAAPVTYQWRFNLTPIPGANSATYTIPAATAAAAGAYSVVVSSELGSAISPSATLTVATLPRFLMEPANRAVGVGGLTSFQVVADGPGPLSYQWRKDGSALPGASQSVFTLAEVTAAHAGAYTVQVTNAGGAVSSAPATLTVLPNPIAYSARQYVGAAGAWGYFSLEGGPSKQVLLRAVGPTLASLGVTGVLVDPVITLYNAAGQIIATNDNWGDVTGVNLPVLSAQMGALALPAGSKDAVVYAVLAPGSYSVRVGGVAGATGLALLELYDTDTNPGSRLAYVGLKGRVDATAGALSAGLTMTNSAAKRLLLRAVGPALGTGTAHPDPLLRILDGATVFAENDNWGGTAALASAMASAGAFALPASSNDAAVLVERRVGSGVYTAQVPTGVSAGDVLIEFYDLPVSGDSALAPLVLTGPSTQTVAVGAGLTLRAMAIGRGPLTYQWRRNGVGIADGTGASLVLAAAASSQAGNYDVLVTNALGAATSTPALITVGTNATHGVAGFGYFAGGTVTLTNTLSYTGVAGSLGWSISLPAGWTFASDAGAAGDIKPQVGETGMISWAWTNVPPSPVVFSYTVNVPPTESGPRTLAATALVRPVGGNLVTLPVTPDPLELSQITVHSGDTDRNFRFSLLELTRVIELYNVRNGTTRTGAYAVATGSSEDGFVPEPARSITAVVTLARHHAADSNRDGKISLLELTRVIELYNVRSGTTRTGQYHVQPGTEDGYAPGP